MKRSRYFFLTHEGREFAFHQRTSGAFYVSAVDDSDVSGDVYFSWWHSEYDSIQRAAARAIRNDLNRQKQLDKIQRRYKEQEHEVAS